MKTEERLSIILILIVMICAGLMGCVTTGTRNVQVATAHLRGKLDAYREMDENEKRAIERDCSSTCSALIQKWINEQNQKLDKK